MNVNGITNSGYPAPPGLEERPVSPQGKIPADSKPDPEKIIPQPSRVTFEERQAQVISKDEIIQLLSLKLPNSRSEQGGPTGRLIDLRS